MQLSKTNEKRLAAVGVMINKCRMVQNWGLLTPDESAMAERIWLEQLDRHGVPVQHYSEIINRAIDRRIMHLAKGEQAPMLSVELLLAMFRELKADIWEEFSTFKRGLEFEEGFMFQLAETFLSETIAESALNVARERYGQNFKDHDAAQAFIKAKIGDVRAQYVAWWAARHLPDEATQWQN